MERDKFIVEIKTGDGLLRQINNIPEYKIFPYIGCQKIKTTVVVSDVGDYSIFIKKNLSRAKGVLIKSKKHPEWIETRDIFPTASGSVLYFDEKIKEFFKENCIYPVIIYQNMNYRIFEKFIGEYLKKYRNFL